MKNESADLVVIGYGGAGAAAALRASELGASVIILEKQSPDRHTPSTRMSGGIIMGVSDINAATIYLERCARGMVPASVSRTWATRARDVIDWLKRSGTDLEFVKIGGAEHPDFSGADAIDVYQQVIAGSSPSLGGLRPVRESELGRVAAGLKTGSGPAAPAGEEFFAGLQRAVERRSNIRIMWDSPARKLITDQHGRVIGVEADAGSTIRCGSGAVLACGGYEYDDVAKLNYLKATPIYFYGNPGNTGDGIRLAQAVGADLWHMNQMIGRAIGHFSLENGDSLNFLIAIHPPGYVITDKFGKRFANEYSQATMKHDFYYHMLQFDPDRSEFPRIPSYWFFDQRRLSAGPLTSVKAGAVGVGLYDWSISNAKEVELGWINSARTIEEAARQSGVADPEAAQRSVAQYNEACRTGKDPFGRPADSLIPIDQPPFCCVPLFPGGSNTSGGPRRSERAEILNVFGEPIPGLYGAGELGQAIGLLYPANGCNLSEAQCFGQIAAESALGV